MLCNVSEPPSRIYLLRIFLPPPFLAVIRKIIRSQKFCDIRYLSVQSSSPGCLSCPPVTSRESVVLPSSTAHSSYLAAYHLNKVCNSSACAPIPWYYTLKGFLYLFVNFSYHHYYAPVPLFVHGRSWHVLVHACGASPLLVARLNGSLTTLYITLPN